MKQLNASTLTISHQRLMNGEKILLPVRSPSDKQSTEGQLTSLLEKKWKVCKFLLIQIFPTALGQCGS